MLCSDIYSSFASCLLLYWPVLQRSNIKNRWSRCMLFPAAGLESVVHGHVQKLQIKRQRERKKHINIHLAHKINHIFHYIINSSLTHIITVSHVAERWLSRIKKLGSDRLQIKEVQRMKYWMCVWRGLNVLMCFMFIPVCSSLKSFPFPSYQTTETCLKTNTTTHINNCGLIILKWSPNTKHYIYFLFTLSLKPSNFFFLKCYACKMYYFCFI